MSNLAKSLGLLFFTASAVYSGPASYAESTDSASPGAGGNASGAVRLLDDEPTTRPAGSPATQPAVGQSVTAQQVNVSDGGTVEIHVNDANLVEVLRMLSLQSQKNIIASKDVRGTVTANLYDVTVHEALDAILHSNGYDYREKGNFVYVYTTRELREMEKAARVAKTELFRLYYTSAADALVLIKPVLSSDGQVAITPPAPHGIDSSHSDAGGNSHAAEDLLVVTDYAENLDRVRKVLKEIDRRPQQILVEATIVRATLNDNNSLGIDFTALGGVNFNQLSAVSTGGTGSGLQQALNGQITQNNLATSVIGSGFGAANFGGNGLNVGIVNSHVGVFIQALEGITDTVVVGNPKVLVLNKQKGEVHVGSRLGYKTSVTTDTLTASDVKFLETGTRLIFRPYVGDEGNIRMEIHPEDSSGTVNDQGLPNEDITEVTTNVMVKDGNTIVIGGLFREATTRTRSQVPFLGGLPGVGLLFRKQADTSVREEVIVLLTPHIVKDDRAYAAASEEQLNDAERMRVGMRRGLMPWGRQRLADSWYENAVAEMNKPNADRQKVLWDLNAAINLNPQFAEATELKTRITGREVTAPDNSAIRSFVTKQILADRAKPAATEPAEPSSVPLGDEPQVRRSGAGPAGEPPKQRASAAGAATRPAAGDAPAASVLPEALE